METRGLITGIGSLPYKDVEAALDLIFKYTPEIPFWPQLPKRDYRERMLIQYSQNLPCLRVKDKDLFCDFSSPDEELAKFYEHIIADDREYFKISPESAAGLWQFLHRLEENGVKPVKFIKGHITGPFTFAASLKDNDGKLLLHNPVFMQAICEGLAMKALWQIDLFKKFGKPVIIFLDEPYLSCFGSAFSAVNRKEVIDGLSGIVEKIKSAGGLAGVHCCGNTDWSIFTDVPGMDIINFDAFNFLDRVLLYAPDLLKFLKQGGVLAWGIVPTDGFGPDIKPDILARKLKSGLELLISKGIDKNLLKKQLILTPSCGLGALGEDMPRAIFQCLAETAASLQKSI